MKSLIERIIQEESTKYVFVGAIIAPLGSDPKSFPYELQLFKRLEAVVIESLCSMNLTGGFAPYQLQVWYEDDGWLHINSWFENQPRPKPTILVQCVSRMAPFRLIDARSGKIMVAGYNSRVCYVSRDYDYSTP